MKFYLIYFREQVEPQKDTKDVKRVVVGLNPAAANANH